MDVLRSPWVPMAAGSAVVVLGVALAVTSLLGLALVDEFLVGGGTLDEARAYDATWQAILGGLTIAFILESAARLQWMAWWLGVSGLPRAEQRREIPNQLTARPPVEQRLYRASSILGSVGLAGILVAVGVSLIGEDLTSLRLSTLPKAVGGIAFAGGCAAFISLVWRNRSAEPAAPVRRRAVR